MSKIREISLRWFVFECSFFVSGGVDTAAVGSTYDISNLDRLGYSEVCLQCHQLVFIRCTHLSFTNPLAAVCFIYDITTHNNLPDLKT